MERRVRTTKDEPLVDPKNRRQSEAEPRRGGRPSLQLGRFSLQMGRRTLLVVQETSAYMDAAREMARFRETSPLLTFLTLSGKTSLVADRRYHEEPCLSVHFGSNYSFFGRAEATQRVCEGGMVPRRSDPGIDDASVDWWVGPSARPTFRPARSKRGLPSPPLQDGASPGGEAYESGDGEPAPGQPVEGQSPGQQAAALDPRPAGGLSRPGQLVGTGPHGPCQEEGEAAGAWARRAATGPAATGPVPARPRVFRSGAAAWRPPPAHRPRGAADGCRGLPAHAAGKDSRTAGGPACAHAGPRVAGQPAADQRARDQHTGKAKDVSGELWLVGWSACKPFTAVCLLLSPCRSALGFFGGQGASPANPTVSGNPIGLPTPGVSPGPGNPGGDGIFARAKRRMSNLVGSVGGSSAALALSTQDSLQPSSGDSPNQLPTFEPIQLLANHEGPGLSRLGRQASGAVGEAGASQPGSPRGSPGLAAPPAPQPAGLDALKAGLAAARERAGLAGPSKGLIQPHAPEQGALAPGVPSRRAMTTLGSNAAEPSSAGGADAQVGDGSSRAEDSNRRSLPIRRVGAAPSRPWWPPQSSPLPLLHRRIYPGSLWRLQPPPRPPRAPCATALHSTALG